jgi:hypothetical protein
MSKDTIFSDAPIKKAVKEMPRHSTASASFFRKPLIDLTQYELLEKEDILTENDEFYYTATDTWQKTTCIGEPVAHSSFYRRRRNIR